MKLKKNDFSQPKAAVDFNQPIPGEEPSELYAEALKMRPEFNDNQSAASAFSNQLEALASKWNLTVEDFLEKAEHSSDCHEDYLTGLSLARKIAYFKE